MLYHFNDKKVSLTWYRDLLDDDLLDSLKRPGQWDDQEKIVNILCYCLLDNHFHILFKEIKEGGVSKFMQRLGIGMAKHFNEKYKEQGSLFQGAYRSKTIENDTYLRYVSAYIQVKNVFEMNPMWTSDVHKNFDEFYEWAENYDYCSLGNYSGSKETPIIDKEILGEIFTPEQYKKFSFDFITGKYNNQFNSKKVTLE